MPETPAPPSSAARFADIDEAHRVLAPLMEAIAAHLYKTYPKFAEVQSSIRTEAP